jgi:predicted RNA-binding protein
LTAYYVFTVTGNAEGQRVAAADLLKDRLNKGMWPLNRLTPHQARLREGDLVLFYVAGGREPEQGSIVALGEVSGSRVASSRLDNQYPAWIGIPGPVLYDVPVRQSEWFQKPVAIRELTRQLTFIRNQKAWGTYFQGGVRRIPEEDFKLILAVAHRA